MKYYKRLNEYKASNVCFDPTTNRAYSYGWWRFVDVIDGLVVFNNYNYSPTTINHQYKVRALLRDLGITIDREIAAPGGLQDLNSARKHYLYKIQELTELINKPRTRHSTNERRKLEIQQYKRQLLTVDRLLQSKQQ